MTMACRSCGHENRAANRFCEECGATLAGRCGSCGGDVPPAAKFCGACGAPAEPVPGRVGGPGHATEGLEARKVVTIVFADLIGSTALHERLDAESVRSLMGRYYGALQAVVEAHGGRVVKLLGDGVMAAFGLPRVAEDDAVRAVRAAVAMQQAVRALAREQGSAVGALGLRVAVNTGEVVVNAATDDLVGDPINVAARLQDAARDGDVVLGDATRRLVGALVTLVPLGSVALKGRAEQVAAYRVESLERPGGGSAVAFVGREDELARLGAVYEAARAAPGARLAVVLGSPGLGKSRLLDEFTRRLPGATVLVSSCEAAGGATFAPLARALRATLGLGAGPGGAELRTAIDAAVQGTEADRGRIAAGIGALLAGTPAAPEETFFVVRRLLAGLAAAQPVVLALDDLHWAEPLLLDLVEHLVQWTTGVPLLLLAAARPELRDTRSALATPGRLASDVVVLGGLDAAAATRLAANVVGADALPAAITGRVLATSEGNPLFLGELVRMLVDDGVLKREGERWTAGVDLASVEMPPTIRALLAARIERLGAEDRLVLERAAIVGRQFSRTAVAHLLPRAVADLDARVEALRRSELIEPDATWFLGEPALKFHHGLIRDAAYRRVLKGTRAELHARVADWIADRVGEAVEHDETIGWHLEQAHRHLGELGPLDAQGRALGERASGYLAAAGRRALARDDVSVAADLLGRAVARLDAADPARAELALDWCEALLAAGQVGPAGDAIEELGRWLGADGAAAARLRGSHTCFAAQRAVLTDPQALRTTAATVAGAAEALAAVGDAAGEAKAHQVHAMALARLGRIGACEAALDQALAAARRAHDRRRANAVLAGVPLAALWGPGPVPRASGRCLDVVRVLRITQGAPGVEAVALRCQAVLEALRGRAEAAERMLAASRRMVEELGITQGLLETEAFAGFIALIEGDTAAAERSLRAAYEGFRTHGLAIDAARAAALLGRTLLQQGRAAEAEALSHEGEALAGDDLEAAITWRRVRAEALARRGEHAAAVDFARAAVDLAATTDALLHHADARWALAAALRAAGRAADAAAEEARAVELWEAKGATVLVEQASGDIGRAEPVARAPGDRAGPARPVRRRVEANAATACAARLDAAIAARDVDALSAVLADEAETLDHMTGTTWDREALLRSFRYLLRAEEPTCRSEPLASLGDSLALFRQSISASGFAGATFDVGAYKRETIGLTEVDAQGRQRRAEGFAVDHLGDAVVRLYERYAELLPEGPARARAAATARSVAALLGSPDFDRYAMAVGPDVEMVHHRGLVGQGSSRGRDAWLRVFRVIFETEFDVTVRTEDILGLTPEACLVRWESSGTDRATGGTVENTYLMLAVFGPDGLLARNEYFAPGHEDEALARFGELVAGPATVRVVQRRVRPNAATVTATCLEAAIAARDADTLSSVFADEVEFLDHTTGTTWDRGALPRSWDYLLYAEDATYRQEPLATLGDSLVLYRWSQSASGFTGATLDVGAYQREGFALLEVDAEGRHVRGELFAGDRLGAAVARLYERYAELLPDGPARARAAATARSVAAFFGPPKFDRWSTAVGPDVELVHHRGLVGLGSSRGRDAWQRVFRVVFETLTEGTTSVEDILDLTPEACLVRWETSGTDRATGGVVEQTYLMLAVFGSDGLLARHEWFAPGHEAEALARFHELVAEPATVRPVQRRVRPNAATTTAARWESAVAARDADAVRALLADRSETLDHTTGKTWDREGSLRSLRYLLQAENPTLAREMLATLGDSLALWRQRMSASGFVGGRFDVGAYQIEHIEVGEVDARGRHRWGEIFAADHLGDAMVRLYERYAELLPDGPERVRVAGIARSVALTLRSFDLDRYADTLEPAIEVVDHRTLGTWSSRGAEECLRHIRALLDLAEDVTLRDDDILALQPGAFLVSPIFYGTDRASGGAYEVALLALCVFGADGRHARIEYFDLDRAAEALARFDELTAERVPPPAVLRRVRPNTATALAARLDAAIVGRDLQALPDLFADKSDGIDHGLHTTWDRQAVLSAYRSLALARMPTCRHEPLATLGDSLALFRCSISASGFAGATIDVGPYEKEEITLSEVDAQGRHRGGEIFAADHLGDAIVRLYERYAELLPEGPARTRAAAIARSVALERRPMDLDRFAEAFAPDIEVVDHRPFSFWSVRGAEELVRHIRSALDLADVALRDDDILALEADALLVSRIFFGSVRASGGAYEVAVLALQVYGTDGLLTRGEFFDSDRAAEALVSFDELSAERVLRRPVQRRVVPNAATATAARIDAVVAAWDFDALLTMVNEAAEFVEHPAGLVYGREGMLRSLRSLLGARDPAYRHELLATLGDVLALCRLSFSARGVSGGRFEVGAYEMEKFWVVEVDGEGRLRRVEAFTADHLGDGIVRLYERYAELLPDGPARTRAAATARSVAATTEVPADLDRYTAFAPAIECVDHRILGTWAARGAEEFLRHWRSLLERADDVALREDDVLGLRSDALLVRRTHLGTDRVGGGPYERQFLVLFVFGTDGLVTRDELFDSDREAEALARLDELGPSSADGPPPASLAPSIENAATRAYGRALDALQAQDWQRFAALFAPGFRGVDRRKLLQNELDRDAWLASYRPIVEMTSSRPTYEVLATRGDRLMLARHCWQGADELVGPSEIEFLLVVEVDGRGDHVGVVMFDLDDFDAPHAELDRRYAAGEAAAHARASDSAQRLEPAEATKP
jgi:class 3 adenylate cyclase